MSLATKSIFVNAEQTVWLDRRGTGKHCSVSGLNCFDFIKNITSFGVCTSLEQNFQEIGENFLSNGTGFSTQFGIHCMD